MFPTANAVDAHLRRHDSERAAARIARPRCPRNPPQALRRDTPALTFTTTTSGPPTTDAVAFQINTQHSGAATTACPVSLPSSSLWTASLASSASYALIANGQVFATAVNSSSNATSLYGLSQSFGSATWGPVSIGNMGSVESGGAAYDAGSVFLVSVTELPNVIEVTSGVSASNGLDSTPAVTSDSVVTYACNVCDFVPSTGAPVWHYSGGSTAGGGLTPVVANSVLYFATTSSLTTKMQVNAETGAQLGSTAIE
jgi:hypothetical protein